MQQVLNWITANPAAVMVAGAGVALALVCYLVLRRGRVPTWDADEVARVTHMNVWRADRHGAYTLHERIPVRTLPITDGDPSSGPTWRVSNNPVPYGSKPDESARPVTKAELDAAIAQVALGQNSVERVKLLHEAEVRIAHAAYDIVSFRLACEPCATRIFATQEQVVELVNRLAGNTNVGLPCATPTTILGVPVTVVDAAQSQGRIVIRAVYESWVNRSNA